MTHTSVIIAKASEVQCTNALLVWWAKTAQSDQAIAILAARSPSGEENAYVAAVASRKKSARKTKTLVQMPARSLKASTPNASKSERTTKTVVQP